MGPRRKSGGGWGAKASLITGLVIASSARAAHADTAPSPPPIELSWDTAGSEALCPSADEMLAEIEQLLGQSSAPRKKLVARARIRRSGSAAWRVTLATRTEERAATRAFTASTCKEAASAAALIMALAIDASVRVAPPAEEDAPALVDEPPVPDVVTPPAQQPRKTPPPASRGPGPSARPSLSAFGGVDVARGVLPETALGGDLGVALALAPARIEIAGAYSGAPSARLAGEPIKGASFHRTALALRACLGGTLVGIELAACVKGGATRVAGAAFGTTQSIDGSATWPDAGVSGIALWRFTRALALRLGVGVAVPARRPRFVISGPSGAGDTTLFRPAAVALDATLGLEARFF